MLLIPFFILMGRSTIEIKCNNKERGKLYVLLYYE